MNTLILFNIYTRRKFYFCILLGVSIVSIFLPASYVIFFLFLILIRILQICNHNEILGGEASFYYQLPKSRASLVIAKNLSVFILVISSIIMIIIVDYISNFFSIPKYEKDYTQELDIVLPIFGFLVGSFIITTIQHFYFTLPYENVLLKNKILGLLILLIMVFFFQFLEKDSLLFENIYNFVKIYRFVLVIISVIIFSIGTMLTIKKVSTMDIEYD